jgi:hypothetical protein
VLAISGKQISQYWKVERTQKGKIGVKGKGVGVMDSRQALEG